MQVLRLLVKPRWLLRHLIVIGMCIGFVFLSRWQFHRGEETSGTVQNYGYSIEWLVFGGCVCYGWWKMLQDELHPEGRTKKARAQAARVPRSSPWRTPVAASAMATAAIDGSGAREGSAVEVPAARGVTADPDSEAQRQILHSPDGSVPATLLAGRRPEQLTTAMIDPDDEEVVAYNAWLAELRATPKTTVRERWL